MTIAGGGPATIFAMYRAGDGPWRDAPRTSSGFVLEVSGAYVLVTACTTATGVSVEELAATAADGPGSACAPARDGGAAPVAPVTARGTMAEPGSVSLGGTSAASNVPGWQFALDVQPGTHDLLAIAADGRAIVRRGLRVDASTALPPVDVAGGAPMLDARIAGATPDPGEAMFSASWLETRHDAFLLSQGTTPDVRLAPPSQIAAGDTEAIELGLDGDGTSRSAIWRAHGPAAPPASVALLPALGDAALAADGGAVTATWTPLAARIDRVELSGASAHAAQHVVATAAWLARHGDGQLALDTSAPGFAAAWALDAEGGPVVLQLVALRRDAAAAVSYTTSAAVERDP